MPISEAPGKLKNREDRKVLATEKEKVALSFVPLTLNTLKDYSHIVVLRVQFSAGEYLRRSLTGLKTAMNV